MSKTHLFWAIPAGVILVGLFVWQFEGEATPKGPFPQLPDEPTVTEGDELATFGSGCFWCTEAVFQQLSGVKSVVSGYSGGHVENPKYRDVTSGKSGHAEVVQVTFDPKVVSYAELLEVFWRTHDPTTKNRQGNDVGPQYRSVIFTHGDRQQRQAERYKSLIDEAKVFSKPIVTEIVPSRDFTAAEREHQDFFDSNPKQPYCRAVIVPKIEKLKEIFRGKLRE